MWSYIRRQLGVDLINRKLDNMSAASEAALGRLTEAAVGAILALRAARTEVARLEAENRRLVDEDAAADAAQADAQDSAFLGKVNEALAAVEAAMDDPEIPADVPVEGATEPDLVQPDEAPAGDTAPAVEGSPAPEGFTTEGDDTSGR